MEITLDSFAAPPQPPVRRRLPTSLRILFISSSRRAGRWLTEALACDTATEIDLDEAISAAAGMKLLRDVSYDAILLIHDPPELDALSLVEGLRGSAAEEPVIVLGEAPQAELEPLVLESGADAYCRIDDTSVRALIWILARAVERAALLCENRRLADAERQRLEIEHQEASRLLRQQRDMLGELESLLPPADRADVGQRTCRPGHAEPDLPEPIRSHYRDLLRTYVIMGTGNLADELAQVAEALARINAGGRQVALMHLSVLEEIIRGLGNRSGRHVINRADLLALELMVHLTEVYRRRG
ncbi:MAG: hypothetical protein WD030_03805 [Pirellulales bacterium]